MSKHHADNTYDKVEMIDHLKPAIIDVYGRNEYASDIERSMCKIKKCCRVACRSMPFQGL